MNDVIVITGPTASGKSRLAHFIASSVGGEIIVADSMKVYKNADIGTSKPTKKRQQQLRYHLIDLLDPSGRYDVGMFFRDARNIIEDLHAKDRLPVIAGGTALYVTRLMEGLADIPEVPQGLLDELDTLDTEKLYAELEACDPARAAELHPNMRKRIIRALSVYRHTGEKMSELLRATSPPDYNFITIGIDWPREKLYQRIDFRVDKMVASGLVEEAERLYGEYGPQAPVFEGVGYKQLVPYIEGNLELQQAVEDIKRATRNYAKSQLVWWRSREILWLDGERISAGLPI